MLWTSTNAEIGARLNVERRQRGTEPAPARRCPRAPMSYGRCERYRTNSAMPTTGPRARLHSSRTGRGFRPFRGALCGLSALFLGCGESASPHSSSAGNSGQVTGVAGTAASVAGGGLTNATAGTATTTAGTATAGSSPTAGAAGSAGAPTEPVIPGRPDEPLPADAGKRLYVHPLFTDHMVLQRDARTPVWGWSKPGDMITLKIANKSYKWVGDVAVLDDASKASAILTMPKASVSPRATYVP